jgi:hypothetical protein
MLEHERFLIIARPCATSRCSQYEIRDAGSEQLVGMARPKPDKVTAFFGRFSQSRLWPLKLEAFETDDEPLVFIVRRNIGWGRGQVRIADADDHLVGRVLMRGPSAAQSFWILDRNNFVYLTGEFLAERSVHILRSRDGIVLATLDCTKSMMRVEFDATLHDQPLAKMLVLGSALALDLFFPDSTGARGVSP